MSSSADELHRESLRRRLDYLCSFERGWFDGDGKPVPPTSAAVVRRWIDEAPDEELVDVDMYALCEGGVAIERRREFDELAVNEEHEVLADRLVYQRYVRRRGTYHFHWSAYIEVALDAPHELIEFSAGDHPVPGPNEKACLLALGEAIAVGAALSFAESNAAGLMRGECCRAAKGVMDALSRSEPDSESVRGARAAYEAVFSTSPAAVLG